MGSLRVNFSPYWNLEPIHKSLTQLRQNLEKTLGRSYCQSLRNFLFIEKCSRQVNESVAFPQLSAWNVAEYLDLTHGVEDESIHSKSEFRDSNGTAKQFELSANLSKNATKWPKNGQK